MVVEKEAAPNVAREGHVRQKGGVHGQHQLLGVDFLKWVVGSLVS